MMPRTGPAIPEIFGPDFPWWILTPKGTWPNGIASNSDTNQALSRRRDFVLPSMTTCPGRPSGVATSNCDGHFWQP